MQQLLYIESIHQVNLWCEKVLLSFHSGFGSPDTLYVCPGSVGRKKILFALALVTPFKWGLVIQSVANEIQKSASQISLCLNSRSSQKNKNRQTQKYPSLRRNSACNQQRSNINWANEGISFYDCILSLSFFSVLAMPISFYSDMKVSPWSATHFLIHCVLLALVKDSSPLTCQQTSKNRAASPCWILCLVVKNAVL